MQSHLEAMQAVARAAVALQSVIKAASDLHIVLEDVVCHSPPKIFLSSPDGVNTIIAVSGGKYQATEREDLRYPLEVSVEVGGCNFLAILSQYDPLCERLRLRARALAARRKRTGYPGTQHPVKERQQNAVAD